MRLNSKRTTKGGHTLLVVMLFCGILVAALGTYLALTSSENVIVRRSLSWNAALPLAESGIEEAMSHMAKNSTNYTADNWTRLGTNNVYLKSRTNGLDYYTVKLSGTPNSISTITCTGNVHFLNNQYISRVVQVTSRGMVFPPTMGLVAKGFNLGGGTFVDSYNSTNPLYSVNGQYSAALASDKAFMGNPVGGISIAGSSAIRGYVAAAPGSMVSIAGAASVGDFNWLNKGGQSGHATNGFYVAIPDVSLPFKIGWDPSTNQVAGTNYTYFLGGGNYIATNLNAAGASTTMYVDGPNMLYVPGAISLQSITFSTNSSTRLDLYIGSDVSFSPALYGTTPPKFVVWGLPTCTSMDMTGGTFFTGVIYAPEANLKCSGNSQFFGAITCNSLRTVGSFKFHHDLAVGGDVPPALSMLSWSELY
jgi:hypothetical protein